MTTPVQPAGSTDLGVAAPMSGRPLKIIVYLLIAALLRTSAGQDRHG